MRGCRRRWCRSSHGSGKVPWRYALEDQPNVSYAAKKGAAKKHRQAKKEAARPVAEEVVELVAPVRVGTTRRAEKSFVVKWNDGSRSVVDLRHLNKKYKPLESAFGDVD